MEFSPGLPVPSPVYTPPCLGPAPGWEGPLTGAAASEQQEGEQQVRGTGWAPAVSPPSSQDLGGSLPLLLPQRPWPGPFATLPSSHLMGEGPRGRARLRNRLQVGRKMEPSPWADVGPGHERQHGPWYFLLPK